MGILTEPNITELNCVCVKKNTIVYICNISDATPKEPTFSRSYNAEDLNPANPFGIVFSCNGNIKSVSILGDYYEYEVILDRWHMFDSFVNKQELANYKFFEERKHFGGDGFVSLYNKSDIMYNVLKKKYKWNTLATTRLSNFEKTNTGENIIYLEPISRYNNWGGVIVTFEEDVSIEDIIIPTESTVNSDHLLIFDSEVTGELKNVIADQEDIQNTGIKTSFGTVVIDSASVSVQDIEFKSPVYYKLNNIDGISAQTTFKNTFNIYNLKLSDLFI